MPLWKVYHPAGAYSLDDKEAMSKAITAAYEAIPIPRFYVVVIFEEMTKGSCFVGGELHDRFVRFKIDHVARTIPSPIVREWWVRSVDDLVAPYVQDRGFDREFSFDELPADLWSVQGEIPPPFESLGEKRWIAENKASPYTLAEKLPPNISEFTNAGLVVK
ncbi:tautomerase enzyme family protein [Pseudomonas fluorescens]|uniref:Tautomerase enzyme family protein n=1 Tax=Pseudomonas fluorescens TaxID=294 RepID=A0A0P8XNG2_PSEFL|nr:tautomerase family protein [Pseudomonas fluorescens]KPU62124.1 tautomerase enzyme family protein [Pseudomonas fluorescens]